MLRCWQLLLLCNVALFSRLLCTKMTGCINIYMHLCIPLYLHMAANHKYLIKEYTHKLQNWKFWPKQIRKFLWSLKQKQIAKFDSFWGMAPAVPLNSNLISCGKEQDSSNVWTTFKSNVCFQYMKMNILKKDVHPVYFCLMILNGKGILCKKSPKMQNNIIKHHNIEVLPQVST